MFDFNKFICLSFKAAASQLKESCIRYSVQTLWWFNQNAPLCKCPPVNIEKLRETCAFLLRDKVCDLKLLVESARNNNNIENVYNTNARCNRAGSGRLATKLSLKTIPAFSSLDESTAGKPWRDLNNNQGKLTMRRTSSTNCLQEIPQPQIKVLGDRRNFGASNEA